jgi:hypothetical protein
MDTVGELRFARGGVGVAGSLRQRQRKFYFVTDYRRYAICRCAMATIDADFDVFRFAGMVTLRTATEIILSPPSVP